MRTRAAIAVIIAAVCAVALPARAQDDPAVLLDFANGLFLRGLYPEATQEYRRYLDAAGPGANPEAWYRLGESAFASGDFEPARAALTEYRRLAPAGGQLERATLRLAETLQRLERYGEAARLFDDLATNADETSVRTAALYGLGRTLTEDNDPQGAVRPFLRLIENHPGDPRTPFARFQLARVYLLLDELDEAARLFEAVAASEAVEPELRHEARFRAAESHARAGDHERAIAAYETLAREAPDSAHAERAAYGTAWSAHTAGDFERAARAAAEFLESHPESGFAPAARYLRGHSLQELGRLADASSAYDALIATHPDSPFAQRAAIKRAWVRYLDGDRDGAHAAATGLLEAGGLAEADAGDAHYLVALIEADTGNLEAALAAFERVPTHFPDSAFALDAAYKRAETLARLGRTAEAAAAFEAFATGNPEHDLAREALLRGGDAAFFDADFAEAVAQYERVLDTNPEPAVEELTRYRLALSHHNAGRFKESADAFQGLLERFPDSEHAIEAQLRIGEFHLEEGAAGTALAAFEAVLAGNPGSALAGRATRGAGLAHYQREEFAQAAGALVRVIAEYPEVTLDAEACLWLGQYLFDNERFEQAASAFERLLAIRPPYPNRGAIQFKLAESRERAGQTDAALDAFAKVEAVEPDSAWSLDAGYRQALLLEAKGDLDAARTKYEAAARVLEGEAPARARLRLAAMDAQAGAYAAAARGYMMVAVLYDDPALTPEALLGAARAYAGNGETAKARGCYEEILRDFPASPHAESARAALAAPGE